MIRVRPYAYAEPVVTPGLPGTGLEVLDAELIAIDGVPVAPAAAGDARWRRVHHVPVLDVPRSPRWFDPRANPELYLYAAAFLIPAGIVGLVLWGVVHLVDSVATAVATHAGSAGTAVAGGVGLWLLLGLLGGGTAVCAGLHCAGCNRS